MESINFLMGRRLWVIRDFNVWGTSDNIGLRMLTTKNIDGKERVYFEQAQIGDDVQEVLFTELTDWRGNSLPEQIDQPQIAVLPRSKYNAFVIGEQFSTGFRIGRDSSAIKPVPVDLLIYELDRQE